MPPLRHLAAGLALAAACSCVNAQTLTTDGIPEFTALLESSIAFPTGDSAFVTFPDSGSMGYTFTFDNKWLAGTGRAVDEDWVGLVTATVTGAAFDPSQSFGQSSGYVINSFWPTGLTGVNDFAPDDEPNNSGLYYDTIGRGGFNVGNGSSAGIGTWTISLDFTGLANGYLPSGTLLSFIDTGDDSMGNDAETTILTAGLVGGGTEEWMTEIDYSLGLGVRDQPAPVWRGGNTYDVGLETPKLATGSAEYSVVQTTKNIETLVIQLTQGPGGGAHGFEIHAPTMIPEPAGIGLLLAAMLLTLGPRRRRIAVS